jgi:SAM-dependent methyltransferase
MENNYWVYARSLFVKYLLKRRVAKDAPILEVGCGSGIVLDRLARSGFNCRGVELGTPKLLPSVEKLAWTGVSFQSLDAPYRESVRCVLLLDVVEHIHEPEQFLREIYDLIPNLDWVLVTVPARRELWSNYDDYFGHFRRYDRKSLAALLTQTGYEDVEIGYFFHTLYPPMFLFSKLGLQRRVKNSSPKAVWLHRVLAYCYLLDSLLLPKWLVGGSLYAIARRRRP